MFFESVKEENFMNLLHFSMSSFFGEFLFSRSIGCSSEVLEQTRARCIKGSSLTENKCIRNVSIIDTTLWEIPSLWCSWSCRWKRLATKGLKRTDKTYVIVSLKAYVKKEEIKARKTSFDPNLSADKSPSTLMRWWPYALSIKDSTRRISRLKLRCE